MGTDIHGVFQKKAADGSWQDVESNYEQDRHYQLFAALADVRNGYGFAGVKTGESIPSIAARRGLPADFLLIDDAHPVIQLDFIDARRRKYAEEDNDHAVWMGDHSHSWLSGDEMLEWYKRAPLVLRTGILDRAVYEAWDKVGNPASWCGGISGPAIIQIDDTEAAKVAVPGWTHIRCEWTQNLIEELDYFFIEIKRLVELHGEIRFVFGFDS